VLRRLSPTDTPAFVAYRSDPEVGRYQGWSPMSADAAARFVAAMSDAPLLAPDAWCQLAIADVATDRLIGDVGICVRPAAGHAEIGFTLDPGHQRRGLATEAVRQTIALVFEHTSVDVIVAITDARNQPSVDLLRRVGMRLRETVATTFRGEPCMEHVFELRRGGND
jgi:RimJ/RimL family protein N-acetyltransferase